MLALGSSRAVLLCSKTKGADVRLCVFAFAKSRFSHDAAQFRTLN